MGKKLNQTQTVLDISLSDIHKHMNDLLHEIRNCMIDDITMRNQLENLVESAGKGNSESIKKLRDLRDLFRSVRISMSNLASFIEKNY